jgi:DNA-binding HxlR family transcriptional regulator
MDAPNPQICEASAERDAIVRDVLVRVADKWTLLVIDALEGETELRFSRLRDQLPGISQRMLTKTLRQLERDGLVARHVHPVVPPHVDYALTPLGTSLGGALCGIWIWAGENMQEILAQRARFDGTEQ